MSNRHYIVAAEFPAEQIFSYMENLMPDGKPAATYPIQIAENIYNPQVRISRLLCFLRSPVCVSCGVIGTIFRLEANKSEALQNNAYHFNLYARVNDDNIELGYRLVLLTQDHIFPKAYGGTDQLDNLQTMCSNCNRHKSDLIDFGKLPKFSEVDRKHICRKLNSQNTIGKTLLWILLSEYDRIDPESIKSLGEVKLSEMKNPAKIFEVLFRPLMEQ